MSFWKEITTNSVGLKQHNNSEGQVFEMGLTGSKSRSWHSFWKFPVGKNLFLCFFQLPDSTCIVLACGLFLHFESSRLRSVLSQPSLILTLMPHCLYEDPGMTLGAPGWSRIYSDLHILNLIPPVVSPDIPRLWRSRPGHPWDHYPAHHRGGSGDGGREID